MLLCLTGGGEWHSERDAILSSSLGLLLGRPALQR